MTLETTVTDHRLYQRAVTSSKKVRWEIERDVLRGRTLTSAQKFLPDGLTLVSTLGFLSEDEQRFASQIQGRTYANIFGLVERYVAAKALQLTQRHLLGDQVALEALVRFGDEELKHQELFRRVEQLTAEVMPQGYDFRPEPNAVANAVLGFSNWGVLGLTCHIELFTLAHYKESIDPDPALSELWKDIFLFHWKEESQHALLDELEWRAEDQRLTAAERDRGVDDLIALVGAVDGILQQQASADANYFRQRAGRSFSSEQSAQIDAFFLKAYRFQYIGSGLQATRFPEILFGMVTGEQRARIEAALAPLLQS